MQPLTDKPDRSCAPQLRRISLPVNTPIESYSFSGGLKLFLLPNPEADGTRLECIITAGSSWHSNPLAASFTIAMLREGSRQYPGPMLARQLDKLGAFVELSASPDIAWLTAYTHKNNTLSVVKYLISMLLEPEFKKKHFELHKRRQLMRFRADLLRTRTLAQRALKNKLFGPGSAYGQLVEEDSYHHICQQELVAFHRERYGAANMTITIAGHIQNELIEAIATGLSGFQADGSTFFRQPIDNVQHNDYIFVDKPDALQSSIAVGRLIPDRTHPEYPALSLANTILGGYFGSRLMSNLREDKGFTYGIYSQIRAQQMANYLIINTDVGKDVTQEAVQQIYYEMRRLHDEPVLSDELQLVKNYLAGTYAQALDGVYNKALHLRSLIPFGLGLEYYNHFLEQIQETTAEQVMQAAQKYFEPDAMITVVAGSGKTL